MTLEHTKTNIESTPEIKPNPVAETQLRTHEKVLHVTDAALQEGAKIAGTSLNMGVRAVRNFVSHLLRKP